MHDSVFLYSMVINFKGCQTVNYCILPFGPIRTRSDSFGPARSPIFGQVWTGSDQFGPRQYVLI